MLLWSTLAFAHPHPEPAETYDEEIVVWGDPFLQWDQRWLVKTEFRFPVAQWLSGGKNVELPTLSMRVRAVLDCDRDRPRGKRRWDVTCTIDDVALQALQPDMSYYDARLVLEEWDALLTGQTFELRVSEDREILATDLPATPPGNREARRRQEWVRQLAVRLLSPLQMELPDWVSTGSQWFEKRTRLLQMPTITAPFGITELVHHLDEIQGHWVVQSQGRSTMVPGVQFARSANAKYRLQMAGVTRFDPSTGLMVERIWHVGGRATASSARGHGYHNFGQLLLLDDTERPYLGRTYTIPLDSWAFDPSFAPGV